MNKNFDVIALGELLIDFTENGVSGQGNPIFEANPGGAPCNVLAMLNNLGKKTSFLGVVGKDQFGTSLRNTLNSLGIDTSRDKPAGEKTVLLIGLLSHLSAYIGQAQGKVLVHGEEATVL